MPPKLPLLRRLRYLLEAAGVHLMYGFFKVLPVDMASNAGGAIMRTIGPRLSATRKARRHLEFAFPGKTAKEYDQIITGMWDNLGRVFAEYPHLDKISDRLEIVGSEIFKHIQKSGRPAIFVGGHFANWEACSLSAGIHGIPLHLVYRKPNNPYVDGLLQRSRYRAMAASNIPKGSVGARAMITVLKNNECLGVLMDQKNNKGVEVPFFGKGAMTATAAMDFSLRFKCPVYPVRIERTHGAHFKITVLPAMKVPEGKPEKDIVYEMLTDLNKLFEHWITERPEQWLWLHRRWPKGEI